MSENLNSSAIHDWRDSAFHPGNDSAYQQWRSSKLAGLPDSVNDLIVDVADAANLTVAEANDMLDKLSRYNTVVYRQSTNVADHKAVAHAISRKFHMQRLDNHLCAEDDAVSCLTVMPEGTTHEGYIPYTNRAINWHTDGYYNTPDRQIRSMLLHCEAPAASGGENQILDHELVYIQLRDLNPDYIRALMENDVMTIPANISQGVEIRPAMTGPVFSLDPVTGDLHMRFTARTRSIEWKDNELVNEAVTCLHGLLTDDNPYVMNLTLASGEGVLTNNVLHNRTAFQNDVEAGLERSIYRARYYDRVTKANGTRS